jgi:hypothetical protein
VLAALTTVCCLQKRSRKMHSTVTWPLRHESGSLITKTSLLTMACHCSIECGLVIEELTMNLNTLRIRIIPFSSLYPVLITLSNTQ